MNLVKWLADEYPAIFKGELMKKLFRFKYEPCNGTCYSYGDDFYYQLRNLSSKEKYELVELVVSAHDNLCDNPEYYFGLDKCEKTGLFIGHFIQPTRADIFTGTSLKECIEELCSYVIKTTIPKKSGICNFGNNGTENLAQQILEAVA